MILTAMKDINHNTNNDYDFKKNVIGANQKIFWF